jgi:hypothetical protein
MKAENEVEMAELILRTRSMTILPFLSFFNQQFFIS